MPTVEIVPSPWSPPLIIALFGAVAGLIVALTGLIVAVKTQARQANAIAEKTHDLMNGANTALLSRIERLTLEIARLTGQPRDEAEAIGSRHDVDAKAAIIASQKA